MTLKASIVYNYIVKRLGKNKCAWPSVTTIAGGTGIKVRTVQYALRELEQSEYIFTRPRYRDNGSQTSNTYYLHRGDAESAPLEKTDHYSVVLNILSSPNEIQQYIQKQTDYKVSFSFAAAIKRDYPLSQLVKAVAELRRQLNKGIQVRNLGGWIRAALKESYELVEAV